MPELKTNWRVEIFDRDELKAMFFQFLFYLLLVHFSVLS